MDTTASDLTRRQFERAAQLAARPDDAYAARWAQIHDAIAAAAVKRQLQQS